jgi:uncharacterized cupin superfamily protein
MATVETIHVTNVSAQDYEPYMVGEEQFGNVHWLRSESGGEGQLSTGLWTCEPRTVPYTFPGDETFQVLEGELRIEMEGGDAVDLKTGDLVSFPKGRNATWTIKAPCKLFFVISG